MALSPEQRRDIAGLLTVKIREKLNNYHPETEEKPFHVRLLGKDRMAVFSFVHSINTMLGMSIFEQVAVVVAKPRFDTVGSHHTHHGFIGDQAVLAINAILRRLRESRIPIANEERENAELMASAMKGDLGSPTKSIVDFFATKGDTDYFFELKTVKPNIDVFAKTKQKLLDWRAMQYSTGQIRRARAFVALPYNPEAPLPYARYTLQGLYEVEKEVLVAEEFWDFLGGVGAYDEILKVFEQVGIELRDEIDARFKEFEKFDVKTKE